MIADVIEREILIEAPVETVWRVLTEPGLVSQWFADFVELDPRPGGAGASTRLRVIESGFAELRPPDGDKAAYIDTHAKCWDIHLTSLQDCCARQHS